MQAQVKVRGNWTTSYEKKPLRIKFAEKQSMGELNGGQAFKNWLLLLYFVADCNVFTRCGPSCKSCMTFSASPIS